MNSVLTLKDVSVKFYDTCVLKDINLTIYQGDYVNIIGPNGSGKTTLIRLLTGLLEPSTGSVSFGNYRLSYVPQHLHHKNTMPITVYEVLKHSNKQAPDDEKIDYYLNLMDIFELKHAKMNRLSGGQSQRVYIIRALLSQPDVLILDEPTSALDHEFRHAFYDLIMKLHEEGITIIHVTHDLSDGLRHGSVVIHLDQTILFVGSFEAFQQYHSDDHDELEGKHYHV